MDGLLFQEASIKLKQHIPRINIQNLGQHKVFLYYSHTSVVKSQTPTVQMTEVVDS